MTFIGFSAHRMMLEVSNDDDPKTNLCMELEIFPPQSSQNQIGIISRSLSFLSTSLFFNTVSIERVYLVQLDLVFDTETTTHITFVGCLHLLCLTSILRALPDFLVFPWCIFFDFFLRGPVPLKDSNCHVIKIYCSHCCTVSIAAKCCPINILDNKPKKCLLSKRCTKTITRVDRRRLIFSPCRSFLQRTNKKKSNLCLCAGVFLISQKHFFFV